MRDKIESRQSKHKARKTYDDRFFPYRAPSEADQAIQHAKLMGFLDEELKSEYARELANALFATSYEEIQKAPTLGFSVERLPPASPKPAKPKIRLNQERALDAPNFANDYYSNPLCWAEPNKLYIGLDNQLYGYNISNGAIIDMGANEDTNVITALGFNNNALLKAGTGPHLELIDTETDQLRSRIIDNAAYRCIVPDFENSFFMISNDDSTLSVYDIRASRVSVANRFAEMPMACAYNPSNYTLGVNLYSRIHIYDTRMLSAPPKIEFTGHSSPSKALAFSPDGGNYIATGGGRDDRTLMVWNAKTGRIRATTNKLGQVSGIHWIDSQTLFVTEGAPYNRVACWQIEKNKLSLANSSTAHSDRVLVSTQNPGDPKKHITVGADEKLCFWSVDKQTVKKEKRSSVFSHSLHSQIR